MHNPAYTTLPADLLLATLRLASSLGFGNPDGHIAVDAPTDDVIEYLRHLAEDVGEYETVIPGAATTGPAAANAATNALGAMIAALLAAA